jgi:hypothetical protein
MSKLVISGAKLKCNQGTSQGTLTVLPTIGTDADEQPTATVNDYTPMVNIGSFGMCQTQANPQVAAATSAAQGVLTPQPCIPVVTSAWSPGSSVVTIKETAALTDDSKCNCQWTGSIEITDSGTGVEVD